jgi:hypothetical protein
MLKVGIDVEVAKAKANCSGKGRSQEPMSVGRTMQSYPNSDILVA